MKYIGNKKSGEFLIEINDAELARLLGHAYFGSKDCKEDVERFTQRGEIDMCSMYEAVIELRNSNSVIIRVADDLISKGKSMKIKANKLAASLVENKTIEGVS